MCQFTFFKTGSCQLYYNLILFYGIGLPYVIARNEAISLLEQQLGFALPFRGKLLELHR